MATVAPSGPAGGFGVIARGRWATVVHGESWSAVHRVVYAIAGDVDPQFLWLDLRSAEEPADEPGPVELGWIPDSRCLVPKELTELAPRPAADARSLHAVVRSDDREAAPFSDFMRLPPIKQEIAAGLGADHERRVLVIANAERIRSQYPGDPSAIRPLLDAQLSAGLIPIVGARIRADPARLAFDFVFDVEAPDVAHWREGSLLCEKAPPGTPFHAGERTPLSAVSSIARTFP